MEAASRNFTFIRYWEYSNLHYFTKYDKYPCKFPQVTSFSPSMSLWVLFPCIFPCKTAIFPLQGKIPASGNTASFFLLFIEIATSYFGFYI